MENDDTYCIDYSREHISDHKYDHTRCIDDIFTEILNKNTKCMILNLSDNYIRDCGVEKLFNFINENKKIFEHLQFIDLSINKITNKSIVFIKKLLEFFPHLKIDVSHNPIFNKQM